MHSNLSIIGLFLQASLLVKLVMLLLLAMSLYSWTIIFARTTKFKLANVALMKFEASYSTAHDLAILYKQTAKHKEKCSGAEKIFFTGFNEYSKLNNKGITGIDSITEGSHRSMRIVLSRQLEALETGLPALATIGSISPYIGLFGTVWGIMNSFIALGQVQQATLTMVAPGIAEALIATAMGLFAAIPAVMAYNKFSTNVTKLENSYVNLMEEFTSILHRQAITKLG